MANSGLGAPLVVIVEDAGGNAVSGASVTFSAPVSGASGLFSNSTTTITRITNMSGIVSETFTTNALLGNYQVMASVAGVSTPAAFTVTNIESPSLGVTTAGDVVSATDGQTSLREAVNYANSLSVSFSVTGSTINVASNPYPNGTAVTYQTTGTPIAGLMNGGRYFVVNGSATTFQLALTPVGMPITLASTGTGTQTLVQRTVITFDPSLAGDTISLHTVGDNTAGPSEFGITGNVVIQGLNGSSGITIAGDGMRRLFYVAGTGSLELDNLTITGGTAQGGSGSGGALGAGGAIFDNGGSVTLNGDTFTNNTAQGGNGDSNQGDGGGGMGQNFSGRNGGGPNAGMYTGTLGTNGGFGGGGGSGDEDGYNGGNGGFGGGGGSGGAPGNGGFGGGGGVGLASGGTAGFGGGTGTSFTGGGGAGLGGAIFENGGTITVTNSTFTLNNAIGGTGAGNGSGFGGAIFDRDGTLNINFATLSGNIAAQGGRQVYVLGDGSHSGGDPITASGASATIRDSILAQSDTLVSDFVANNINLGFNIPIGNNNIIRTNSDFNGTGTLTDDPQLIGLASNGGPTQTFALGVGSRAIGSGVSISGITTDQRGITRPATPDIGAYQSTAVATTTSLMSDNNPSFTSGTGSSVTLTASVNSSGGTVNSGTVTFTDLTTNTVLPGGNQVAVSNGIATLVTTFTAEGDHIIKAVYSGSDAFVSSNGTLDQRVNNHTVISGTTYSDTGSITLNDPASNPDAMPYPAEIFVSGLTNTINSVSVTLHNVTYPKSGAINALLVGPNGEQFVLVSNAGGDNAAGNSTVTFSDNGATLIGQSTGWTSGTYKPAAYPGQSVSFGSPAPTGP
jgi:hypothetical protein